MSSMWLYSSHNELMLILSYALHIVMYVCRADCCARRETLCIYNKIRLLSMAVIFVYNGHYILMVLSQCSG